MKVNVGSTDRIVRIVIAVALLLGAWFVGFGTWGGVIMLILAAVMVATAAVRTCPLYLPFGISTAKRSDS